jgi:glycosyltransferase involved in cell wall biosynthesis
LSISVVIPTYNRANILKKSIESVLEQTLPVDEVIIVDDFSTDQTKKVVESFQSDKVKYALNSFKKGANGARNTGIMLAKGKYIAFQDSDDRWLPQKIAKQYQYMVNHPKADMCFCSLNLKGSKRGIVPKRKVWSEEIKDQLEKGNFISTQTIFIKKSVAKAVLFDEGLKRFQDWDFVLRVSKDYTIYHLNEVLVEAEIQNDSISKKINEMEALEIFYQKYPEIVETHLVNKSAHNKILYYHYSKEEQRIMAIISLSKYVLFTCLDKVLNKREKL